MPRDKNFKRIVRARMRATGESYTKAMSQVRLPTAGGVVMYPFERFTEHAKKSLTLAQEEAQRSHHSYIGTEHVLLGLLLESEGLAARALGNLGVEIGAVRRTIESVLGRNERIVKQLIPTSRVKKVIEISFDEARRMGHQYVGTEHLLLGLLIEGEGIGAHVLEDLGADLVKVRIEIGRLLADSTNGAAGPQGGSEGQPSRQGGMSWSAMAGEIANQARAIAAAEGATQVRVDHLLRALIGNQETGRLAGRLGLDAASVQDLLTPPARLTKLALDLRATRQSKAAAIAAQRFEDAARYRDAEVKLAKNHGRALETWLARLYRTEGAPPSTA